MAAPIIPECTGKPEDCVLCSMIGMIFEGFPKEDNPGCEVANAEASDIGPDDPGTAVGGRSLAKPGSQHGERNRLADS